MISVAERGIAIEKAKRFANRPVLPVLAAFFFLATFVIKAFTDGPYIRGEVGQTAVYSKYITALIACVFAALSCVGKKEHTFKYEFYNLIAIVIVFSLISGVMALVSNKFSSTVLIELIKLAMPIVLAYFMLNTLDEDDLYHCMLALLVICLAGYAVDLRSKGISFSSIFSADVGEGSSATESSSFSDIALMLTFYFGFFNRRKLPLIISAGFTVLAFKRLAMIVAIIVLLISFVWPRAKRVHISKGFITFLKILTIVLAALWAWLLLPEQQNLFYSMFGRLPFDFTMGRSQSLRFLLESGFQSYGFGSANDVIKAIYRVPFEMDLAKMALELTPVAPVLFVWLFWNVAGTSLWGVLIVGYFMLNMITSDALTSNFAFTIAYMVMGLVNETTKTEDAIRPGQRVPIRRSYLMKGGRQ